MLDKLPISLRRSSGLVRLALILLVRRQRGYLGFNQIRLSSASRLLVKKLKILYH